MTTHKANVRHQTSKSKTDSITSSPEKLSILHAGITPQAAPTAISLTGTNTPAKSPPILAAINPTSPITSTAAISTRFTAPNASSAIASSAPIKAAPEASKTTAPAKPATASEAHKQEANADAKEKPQPVSKAASGKAKAPASKPAAQKPNIKASAATAKTPEKAASVKAAPTKADNPQNTSRQQERTEQPATAASSTPLAQAGLNQARLGYDALQGQKEFWTKGLTASLAAASHGATVLHGKVFDLVRSQTNSTIDLWQKLLEADTMADAIALQTRELRRQFEASSHQIKDIAQTTNRLLTEALTSSLNKDN